jgi:hypothetical protein
LDNAITGVSSDTLSAPASRQIDFSLTSPFDWFFIILGGLPLYLPLILILGESGLGQRNPIYWYFWVNAAISSPHVYSTYCRLSRKIVEQKVSWLMGFPCYLLIVGLLALASIKGYFLQAMTAVNVWQSVHYVRQGYGVSRYYSFKTGHDLMAQKMSYWAFHLAMPLFVLGRWHTLYYVWGGKPSSAIIPVHFSHWIMVLCWFLGGVAIVVGLASEWRSYHLCDGAYNPARAVSLVVFYAIHIFGFLSIRFYQRGFFAVTIFHAVQYLSLVWVMERDHALDFVKKSLNSIPRVIAFPLFWGLIFCIAYVFENKLLSRGNYLWPMLGTIALGAVSAHHYTVDTLIWRRNLGA